MEPGVASFEELIGVWQMENWDGNVSERQRLA